MRIDVLTIFPAYLAPLELSLIGKARDQGLLDVWVRDLRDFTHDRHRTVDDSPYGGGAGMVMRPEPWGEALDALLAEDDGPEPPHLVIPGPAGMPFTQAMARELAAEPWLAFACGRYEGIDERVHAEAATRMPVSVVSLGDYVLNGGEVAVLTMVEAIARLVPGVIGNAESLVEESHEEGLLEYPVYTKPPLWRGLEVPPVLLSGDHGAIREWRHEERLRRTAARRPDLLHPAQALGPENLQVQQGVPADAAELRTLMLADAAASALSTRDGVMELGESIELLRRQLGDGRTWVVREGGRLVASIRADQAPGDPRTWEITGLVVAPDLRERPLSGALLDVAEQAAPRETTAMTLLAPRLGADGLRALKTRGYRPAPGLGAGAVADESVGMVRLTRRPR